MNEQVGKALLVIAAVVVVGMVVFFIVRATRKKPGPVSLAGASNEGKGWYIDEVGLAKYSSQEVPWCRAVSCYPASDEIISRGFKTWPSEEECKARQQYTKFCVDFDRKTGKCLKCGGKDGCFMLGEDGLCTTNECGTCKCHGDRGGGGCVLSDYGKSLCPFYHVDTNRPCADTGGWKPCRDCNINFKWPDGATTGCQQPRPDYKPTLACEM